MKNEPTDNQLTPEQCREGARKMAEWMGWTAEEPPSPLWASVTISLPAPLDKVHKMFNPFYSRDDLAPVLAEIAKRGLWQQWHDHFFSSVLRMETPPLIEAQDSSARVSGLVSLAPPHVLASAALATIEGEKGETA